MAALSDTAVIYVRISRDREGAGLGVERQEKDCRALAERLGLRVVDVYVDNDMSAYSGKPRRNYRRMMGDLDTPGAPRTVLVWHTDRLHRSPIELEEWISLAEARGITVQTVKAGLIDLSTPSGRMIARQLGAIARYESEHKSERLQAKMDEKAASGQWLGGPVPFGWRQVAKGKLALELPEAALIATGTRALLDGGNMRAVVRAWEASGVKARHGRTVNNQWHRRSVMLILKRWRNAGVHEHRGEAGAEAEWPAIPGVTVADVKAVRALLAERSDAYGVGNRSRHLLSGIATCSECGRPVLAGTAAKGRASAFLYRCTAPYPRDMVHVNRAADPIDKLVRDLVAARLVMPDAAKLLATTQPGVDVVALRAERTRVEQLLTELAADRDDPAMGLTRAEYVERRVALIQRRDAAEASLTSSSRRSPLAPILAAPDPAAAFLDADVEMQRAVVREVCTVTLKRPVPGRRPFSRKSVVVDWND